MKFGEEWRCCWLLLDKVVVVVDVDAREGVVGVAEDGVEKSVNALLVVVLVDCRRAPWLGPS